ncbi:MAG: hypothetical protein OXC40_03400, partial [Proteobacteria bacterium]|nr:hypothetical protein [Pseudomonadota bacterium]
MTTINPLDEQVTDEGWQSYFDGRFGHDLVSKSSAYSGFFKLTSSERQKVIADFAGLIDTDLAELSQAFGSESGREEFAGQSVENSLGVMALPLGVACYFLINKVNFFIPMCVEEASVIAAASHGAKLARAGGGFTTKAMPPVTTGQIQLHWPNWHHRLITEIDVTLKQHQDELLARANVLTENLRARGGGIRQITWRFIPEIQSCIIHVDVVTVDAMGANIVNRLCEGLMAYLRQIFARQSDPMNKMTEGLQILTNLALGRLVEARCRIPVTAFGSGEI